MKVLSFIIPCYNSEKYLDKVMDSLLVPGMMDRLDIIIVNDGSSDGTEATAEAYCARYPDTVRLITQENKGHGGALNTGCAAAVGKYMKVIDADDWIETQNLPEFIRQLEQCDSDVVLTHHYTRNITTGEVKKWMSYPPEYGRAYSLEEIMTQRENFDRSLTFHGITYRTDFYREEGILLSEHVFYEDHEYATFPCCHAKSVTPLDLFIYDYRIGDVQQSVSDENQLKRLGHTEAVLKRMMTEFAALPQEAGCREFVCMKIKVLLLSYIATVMLVEPDRKAGRRRGDAMMERVRQEIPRVCELSQKQYRVFRLMNRLHVSKETWERILNSGIYRRLRGNHDFG